MDPINYSIDVQSPMQAAMQGYQAGAVIRNDQQAQQQQQIAQAQAQQQQQILMSLIRNPNANASDYSRAMTALPQLAEPLQKAWGIRNEAQQQSLLSDLSRWGSAIKNGHPEFTVNEMNARADAQESAAGGPTAESQALRAKAQVVAADPGFGLTLINSLLVGHPEGGKVVDSIAKLGGEQRAEEQAPSALLKGQAEATSAATEAGIKQATAPATVAGATLKNEQTAQEIGASKSQQEIAKLNVQIAQANSETERGRLTLQRDELQQKLDLQKQSQATEIQNRADTIANGLTTVDSILKHPGLAWVGDISGKLQKNIPGTPMKDFQGLVDTLQSQQFLSQLAALKSVGNGSSGMGALSDSEGSKLTSAIASLNTDMSQGAFKNALGVIQRNLLKAQAGIAANPQTPTTGGAFVLKHPVFGNVSEGDINRLMQKQPGATRQQIMDFLTSTGGK